MEFIDLRHRAEWREWLRAHHNSASEILLVYHKNGAPSIGYEESVEEALCFGWVDSLIRRIDDHRYARKFTPRKPNARWSTSNRARYAELARRGLLEAPGIARPPNGRSGDAPRPSLTAIPPYIERGMRAHPRAWAVFQKIPPSHQREYLAWIDSAKREETKQKRLAEAIERLAAGQKLGMK